MGDGGGEGLGGSGGGGGQHSALICVPAPKPPAQEYSCTAVRLAVRTSPPQPREERCTKAVMFERRAVRACTAAAALPYSAVTA